MLTTLKDLLRYNREFAIGLGLRIFVLIIASMSFFSPYAPRDIYLAPPDVPPSWAYPLGTNSCGQDVFWQLTSAIRNTLAFGVIVAVMSRLISLVVGLLSGYLGGACISLLNHGDRVRVACLAQLVNVIAPIMTESGAPAWRQSIFLPFAHFSRHGRGAVLRMQIESPSYAATYFDPRGPVEHRFPMEEVPYLKLAAVANESGGLTLFALNRSLDQVLYLDAITHGFAGLEVEEALTLRDDDLDSVNNRDDPGRLSPQPLQDVRFEGERRSALLPPVSWNVLRLQETVA